MCEVNKHTQNQSDTEATSWVDFTGKFKKQLRRRLQLSPPEHKVLVGLRGLVLLFSLGFEL